MNVKSKKNIKRSTAYHEAGHAVARWLQGLGMHEVSIIPTDNGETLGHVLPHKIPKKIREDIEVGISDNLKAEGSLRKEVIVLLAGREAQHLISRRISFASASSDYKQAVDFTFYIGGSEEQTTLWLKLLLIQARVLVNRRKYWISALAEHLLKCERMTGREVKEFLIKLPLPSRGAA